MDLIIKLLESHRKSILMDLDLIKNDTKTRYAIEKRKELIPMLEQVTRAVAILSNENTALPIFDVRNSLFDLDGKTIPVTFHVSKYKPKIDIDFSNDC